MTDAASPPEAETPDDLPDAEGGETVRRRERVVKVGGSLFRDPQLAARLLAWLQAQEAAETLPVDTLLVTGGGELADKVREFDQRFGLRDHQAHWLAIEAMRMLANILTHALSAAGCSHVGLCSSGRLTRTQDTLPRPTSIDPARNILPVGARRRISVLDPFAFMVEDLHSPERLPPTWDVTSDTIAARAALRLGACELVLLKSRAAECDDWEHLARTGFVDPAFPGEASRLQSNGISIRIEVLPELPPN